MAAIFAAGAGVPVLLIERTRDGGRKIHISGGGRCNVLPSTLEPSRFVTASSPNTMRKMLRSWPFGDQRRFFEEELRLPLVLETDTGKLFPASNRARDVRDGLLDLARRRGAHVRFRAKVVGLRGPTGNEGAWQVRLEDGEPIDAAAVVIATGGLSVPRTGSDGIGMRLVRRLGHTLHDTYPALTPLIAEPPVHAPLAGVSLDVTLRAPLARGESRVHGGFLFTHRGYSGPTVLDLSHLAVLSRSRGGPPQSILAQWTPRGAEAWDQALRTGTGATGAIVRRALPTRLAETLLAEAGVDSGTPVARLRRAERLRLVQALTRYPLPWTGDEGYRKAEVTGGGVPLHEVHPRTMESRVVPGLFLCGEILDCFGPIGGHNFSWAWATGRAAGLGAAGVVGASAS
jgi:hypothetical protein